MTRHSTRALVVVALAAFALIGMSASEWSTGDTTPFVCTDGYFRFADSSENRNRSWAAGNRDFQNPPFGVSVFMDLTTTERDTMNQRRANVRHKASRVWKLACDSLPANASYTAHAVAADSNNWIYPGRAKHGVMNAVPPGDSTKDKYNDSVKTVVASRSVSVLISR